MVEKNDWKYLTGLAREYVGYLPVGDNPLSRNDRQKEIVNIAIPQVRPFLFKIAYQLKNGGIKIKNSMGKYSLLSLKCCQVSDEDLVQIAFLELNINFHKYKPSFEFGSFVYVYAGKGMYRIGNRESMFVKLPYAKVCYYRILIKDVPKSQALLVIEEDLRRKNNVKDPARTAVMIYLGLFNGSRDLFGRISRNDDASLESRLDSGVENALDIFERMEASWLFDLGVLDEREKWILRKMYIEDRTLREMGSELKISRERVRQIGLRGKRKIREYLESSSSESL